MKLEKKELEFFEKNGYILLKNFANINECDAIKDIAKIHLKYEIEPVETEYEYIGLDKEEYKKTIRRLRQVYNRDVIFRNWMKNSKIKPILEQILKEPPILITAHHNSIMTKMPHTSTQTCWHRDSRYWHYDGKNLVSIWLALGKETQENGVLEFIPGSHKMQFNKNQFCSKEFFRTDLKENKEIINKKVSYELNKGDVIIFHSELLHRANENKTSTPKISFVYTVKGKSVKALPNTRSAKFKEIEL
jgi:phytanoyl-CoA hydroxylase